MNVGLIYKATSPSGKVYIGQTTYSLSRRISGHNKDAKKHDYFFARAIRKYGIDNFRWKIVEDNIPVMFLDMKECEWIQMYNSYKNGYNSTLGGDFHPMNNPLIIEKVANFHRGRKRNAETCKKISEKAKERFASGKVAWNKGLKLPQFSGENHPLFGSKLSDSHKKKFDRTGIRHTQKTKSKMSISQKGKKHSEETIDKMSKNAKNRTRNEKGHFVRN